MEAAGSDDDSRDLLKYVSDNEELWPSRIVERSELEALVAEAIGRMPAVEKTVLSLYYQEELTLREISGILHLHESRISQLKSQAILRLRSYIEKRWPIVKRNAAKSETAPAGTAKAATPPLRRTVKANGA